MAQKVPFAPPSSPLPPERSKVMTGKVPKDERATVLQGTTPWQVDGDTRVEFSTLPEGAATDASLQQISADIRTLQILEEINETLREMKFILKGIAGG